VCAFFFADEELPGEPVDGERYGVPGLLEDRLCCVARAQYAPTRGIGRQSVLAGGEGGWLCGGGCRAAPVATAPGWTALATTFMPSRRRASSFVNATTASLD
jgi:hypothetical protein